MKLHLLQNVFGSTLEDKLCTYCIQHVLHQIPITVFIQSKKICDGTNREVSGRLRRTFFLDFCQNVYYLARTLWFYIFFQPKWILKMMVISIARVRIWQVLSQTKTLSDCFGYHNMQGCLILEAQRLIDACRPIKRRGIRQ